jgi:hypothetical protein
VPPRVRALNLNLSRPKCSPRLRRGVGIHSSKRRPTWGYPLAKPGAETQTAPANSLPIPMNRRHFAFWFSFGLFTLADRLKVYGLDELAAAMMRDDKSPAAALPTHWRLADNGVWRWFERETFVDGQWKLSGITTPVRMETGELAPAQEGYLDDAIVPAEVRRRKPTLKAEEALAAEQNEKTSPAAAKSAESERSVAASTADVAAPSPSLDFDEHEPSEKRRARHGRPPSKWLRSLHADELRIWLKTIDVPEADVVGMTYWEHLTRDHSFDPAHIEGLEIDEQAKLHAAAHYGY